MQIVLMRHGQSSQHHQPRLSAAEFGRWINGYDAAGIHADSRPPQPAIDQARQCAVTVCSPLARSLESARALGISRIDFELPMFREMEMPHATWKFPRLSSSVWLVFFRLAWMLGYANHAEPFRAAKLRARHGAEQLAKLASRHGSVLFVGHGSLNWFIARHLQQLGWQRRGSIPRDHWNHCMFHRPST